VKLNTDIIKALVPLVAIISIAGMECFAMAHGHDGTILIISVAVISGLAGYQIPNIINKIKNNNNNKEV
jgi:hypothetical protein